MQVGAMVTSYNHEDWPRLLEGDYTKRPSHSDIEIVDATIKLGDMVEPLGYDSIWCAEHYGSAYSMQSNPLQWLSFWAGRTERIDMGSAVLVLPWWQPVKLAHEVAMLDLLLRGRRFLPGVGRGVSAHEYEGFNVPREESRDRYVEMIEILRRSDAEERFSYDGDIYHVPPTTVRPQARHRGDLFTNVRAAFNTPTSMEMAADLGLGQMFVAAETLDVMEQQVGKFNAIRAQKGLAPNQPTTMLYMHCSNDPEEIEKGKRYAAEQGWAARNHYAIWKGHGFAGVKGYEDYAKFFKEGEAVVEGEANIVREEGHLIGTPEQIFEKIQRIQEKISLEYLIVHPQHGSKPPEEARASLKLFAEEVLPAVHQMATPLHEGSLGSADLLGAEIRVGGAISN